ncbi:hypothetical protein [Sporosarcina sp. FSL K6-1508]|uniref:hypothetical protein n=1 Tax=Sporosarcina sp. FSL K6-1508 TaxID=2921553 RepID=UPI0030F5B091
MNALEVLQDYKDKGERVDEVLFQIVTKEIVNLREALEEVRACVDSLYDNDSPRRLHPELVKYAGFISVMDRVTFEALK